MNKSCTALRSKIPLLVLWLALPTLAEADDSLITTSEVGRPGGHLALALRTEPKTFNPILAGDLPSQTVIHRLMADLIHIDRSTQAAIPALAKSWTKSVDGRRFEIELRRGVRFSDGHPLEASDVTFSFEVYLDAKVGSPYRDQLLIGEEPIKVRQVGSHSLAFELAEADAWGERLFNDLPILPEHRLKTAFLEGRLKEVWSTREAPDRIAGLGPFRLKRYQPGERLELERNPYYWKVDREGQRLPYVDLLTFIFVPNADAEALRFQTGETHLIDRLSAANFGLLAQNQEQRDYVIQDLGPGLSYEFLFFNLNNLEKGKRPKISRKQQWFKRQFFRQAISLAIDRKDLVRLIYRGRASPIAAQVSPGNKLWHHAELRPPVQSLDTSRKLLRSAGFTWDEEGLLHDPEGHTVEFSIAVSASNGDRLRMATLIQHDLDQIGMRVHVLPLEFRTLVGRVLSSFDYEACILGLGAGDGDPNSTMAVWLSSGSHHFWNPGQAEPATAWEAEIDRLMWQQKITLEPKLRKELFDRAQEIVADQLPFVFLVSPNVLAGANRQLGNFAPTVFDHTTLWNVDELFWRSSEPTAP